MDRKFSLYQSVSAWSRIGGDKWIEAVVEVWLADVYYVTAHAQNYG